MQAGGRQPPMPKQAGSAQSMRPLPSSSMPLPQISILRPPNAENTQRRPSRRATALGLDDEHVAPRRQIREGDRVRPRMSSNAQRDLIGVAGQPRRRHRIQREDARPVCVVVDHEPGGLGEREGDRDVAARDLARRRSDGSGRSRWPGSTVTWLRRGRPRPACRGRRSGMHSLPTQVGSLTQAASAQSIEAVAVVVDAVVADLRRAAASRSTASRWSSRARSGTTRRSPSRPRPAAPGKVWRRRPGRPCRRRRSTGLLSQAWLAPARKRATTCALPGRLREVEAHVGGRGQLEAADPPDAARRARRSRSRAAAPRVSSVRVTLAPWLAMRAEVDVGRAGRRQAAREGRALRIGAVDQLVVVVVDAVVADLGPHDGLAGDAPHAVGVGAVDDAVAVVVEAVVADLLAGRRRRPDCRSSPDPRSRRGRCSCRPCRCCRSRGARRAGSARAAPPRHAPARRRRARPCSRPRRRGPPCSRPRRRRRVPPRAIEPPRRRCRRAPWCRRRPCSAASRAPRHPPPTAARAADADRPSVRLDAGRITDGAVAVRAEQIAPPARSRERSDCEQAQS